MNQYILGLLGSSRGDSRTKALLELILEQFPTRYTTELMNVGGLQLPQYEPGASDYGSDQLDEFSEKIARADAIILASPVYQASYSGVLKNALDHIHDMKHVPVGFIGKAVGIAAVSEGSDFGRCVAHLNTVATAMGANTVPTPIGATSRSFEGSLIRDSTLKVRANVMARDIVDRLQERSDEHFEQGSTGK